VLALLAVACAAPALAVRGSYVGTREWFCPFGAGHLDLHEDSSFRLTMQLALPDDSRLLQDMVGDWEPCGRGGVTLHVHESHARISTAREVASPMSPGTRIDALIDRDSATYLGMGGLVDLDWGF
jgi:hypothetical protein